MDDDAEDNNKEIPKNVIRYENSHPAKDYKGSIEENNENEEYNESDENDEITNDDVELHQQPTVTATKPRPPLLKEHREGYTIENDVPNLAPTKSQIIIQPSKPIELVQKHPAEYKVEQDAGDHEGEHSSDDSGKGHAGSISKHLYEIYVTHATGKSNGGGSDTSSSGGDDEGGNEKSGHLVLEQLREPNNKEEPYEQGGYQVKINYGEKKSSPKSNKSAGKRKGSLKKKKKQIIKPHKYEVEEYIDDGEETKQPIVAGNESSPQHHRDNVDYPQGQQFIYASEADSDAYYW